MRPEGTRVISVVIEESFGGTVNRVVRVTWRPKYSLNRNRSIKVGVSVQWL
jgi:hypothetical protein